MIPTLLLLAGMSPAQPAPPEPPGVIRLGQAAQPTPEPEPVNVTVTVPPPLAPAEEAVAASAAPTRWPLMRAAQGTWLGVLLDDSRITVNGWTQFSYNASSANGTNLPLALDDRADEFLMNQNYLHVERTVDPAVRKFQLGFVTDWILPGTDYRYTLARGLWNDQLTRNDGRPELYGVDAFQFYGQAFLPEVGPRGTKVILGRFATHCGYELVQAPDTPFVSRSYMFQYNPFTHTGVWAISQLTDAWTVSNGFALGADNFIDPASQLMYLGQLKWAPPTARTSVTFNTCITNPEFDEAEAFAFYNYFGMIVTYKISDRLGYVLDCAYSYIRDVPDTGFTDWYGAANYLTYQISDTVSSTLRFELFNDATGFRTGTEGLYTEVTVGLAWKPLPALLIRPSVRYDYNVDNRPFEGSKDLFTAALEAIVRW